MSAGVCSIVKSKPRRVRRSISDTSLDVHGAVTVEKVWMGEGDALTSDHLQDVAETVCLGRRKRHIWSLHTNLSCTQQCLKCEKRILTRRAAYKCTVCKKLCHLKCASNEKSEIATRTRSQTKCGDQKVAHMGVKHFNRNIARSSNKKKKEISDVGVDNDNDIDRRIDYGTEESESLIEFIMQEDNCKEENCSTQVKEQNTTVQQQAKQSLCNLKTNLVRRCRSIKKKVEKLKDKLNCDDCSKNEENAPTEGCSVTDIEDKEENAAADREAWLCSPVRKRMKARLQGGDSIDIMEPEAHMFAYKRKSCKRKHNVYDLQLSHMNDRLDAVEKKIHDLEQSVPQEIEEWRKLHKKVLMEAYHYDHLDKGESASDETVPKIPLLEEHRPSSSSAATSDDVYVVPESSIGNNKDYYHPLGDRSEREQSFPSAVPPRLQTDIKEAFGCFDDHQTSTPVTNKEISFRSATQKYKLSQVTHTNITHINMDPSGTESLDIHNGNVESELKHDDGTVPNISEEKRILSPNQQAVKTFLDKRTCKPNTEMNMDSRTEQESSADSKILSPNQLAVQKFLERRRSNPSSGFKDTQKITNSPRLSGISTEETNGSTTETCNSPAVVSSTFANGNGDLDPQFNVSPISFTLRNDFEGSAISFTKILEEPKTVERKHSGLEKNAFNMSALSYTFRNDSSMIHTDASENIPGYSDNLPRTRPEIHRVQNNSPRVQFEAFQAKGSVVSTVRPTGNTPEGLSLTNVTEITSECPNSFAENKEISPLYHVDQIDNSNTSSKRLSDEFLIQIKSGVKLKNTSLERKEEKEGASLDTNFGNSELKLIYDKIVNRNRRSKAAANVKGDKMTVDETGDNGHSEFRIDPYSKLGSKKYRDLFRFCSSGQPDVIVENSSKASDLLEKNSGIGMVDKLNPKLPPKVKNLSTSEVDTKVKTIKGDIHQFPDVSMKTEQKFEQIKDESDSLKDENAAFSVVGDTNKNILEVPDFKNNNSQTKAETFPRTSKKFTSEFNYFCCEGGYQKAASYAGSLDHDRRSVYTETGSLDRYGDAKYHFLHEKGMIKICSPRLELVSESPSSKRKYQIADNRNDHISEENDDTDSSSSDVSGVVIDNTLHLTEYKQRLEEFSDAADPKQILESPNNVIESKPEVLYKELHNKPEVTESFCSELQARQQDLANDILENCLEMIDNNQAALDHVFDWINKDCNNSENSIKEELDSLIGDENTAQCPIDESVYYSFQGQSEEIRNVMAQTEMDNQPLSAEDQLTKDLMVSIINGNHTQVSKFLKSGNVIPSATLTEAIDHSIKQKNRPLAKELLDYACELLANLDKNNVIEVWPSYQIEDEWIPVFVVLTVTDPEDVWSEFLEYKVYSRKFNFVSNETELVLNNQIVKNNPLSFNELENIKQAIDLATLHNNSNVTVVSSSAYRSRKGGQEIIRETCIVFHCLVKGLIPFNEQPFPESILGIPVDVREAYFSPGVYKAPQYETQHDAESSKEISDLNESGSTNEGASEKASTGSGSGSENSIAIEHDKDTGREMTVPVTNVEMDYFVGPGGDNTGVRMPQEELVTGEGNKCQPLQIGTAICGTTATRIGTLGAFVPLADGQIGFLTCAHVAGLETGNVVSVVGDEQQHSHRSVCGYVSKAVMCTGEGSDTGVDAAVVTITNGMPISAECPRLTIEQLASAGFSPENAPRTFNGKILTMKELPDQWGTCVLKIGSRTGLTKGKLYSYGTCVRRHPMRNTDECKFEFYNQIEVVPFTESMKFFDLGDSGSLLFMLLNDNELYCVGLAIGCTSYGSCIVTPIEYFFKKLQLPQKFFVPKAQSS